MKRILSTVLVLMMLLSTMPWAAAAARDVSGQESLAEDLKELSLFKGVSDTNFNLGRAPSRVEALVMLVRVLGKEQEALSGQWEHPFTDVDPWADPYVGYAYEHKLTTGVSDTQYGKGDADARTYLTFVLRALGYSDANGQDFTWSQPFALASETGVLTDSVDLERFWRADIVTVSYAALSARLKGSDRTLAQKLMADGVFTPEQFQQSFDPDALKKVPVPDQPGSAQPTPTPTPGAAAADAEKLTAQEISEKCSDAVFYITCYGFNGAEIGTGSGFFISSDGLAVTNYHVASNARLTVRTTDGTVYEDVDILDGDSDTDLALLRVNGGRGFPYLELGNSNALRQGQRVYAIGSPLGLENTMSEGIISNPRRTLDGMAYIQISVPIAAGSSGGALLDEYGSLIGVTTAGFTDSTGDLNLAVGSNDIGRLDRSSTSSYVFWEDVFYPGYSLIYDFGAFSGVELEDWWYTPRGYALVYDIWDFHNSPMMEDAENYGYTLAYYMNALRKNGFGIPDDTDPMEGFYAQSDKEAIYFIADLKEDPCIYIEADRLPQYYKDWKTLPDLGWYLELELTDFARYEEDSADLFVYDWTDSYTEEDLYFFLELYFELLEEEGFAYVSGREGIYLFEGKGVSAVVMLDDDLVMIDVAPLSR